MFVELGLAFVGSGRPAVVDQVVEEQADSCKIWDDLQKNDGFKEALMELADSATFSEIVSYFPEIVVSDSCFSDGDQLLDHQI